MSLLGEKINGNEVIFIYKKAICDLSCFSFKNNNEKK
jgi:hypothetical protein